MSKEQQRKMPDVIMCTHIPKTFGPKEGPEHLKEM